MKLSVDISLYPLQDEYIPIIIDLIHELKKYDDIDVVTNRMSTQLIGDYDRVIDILRDELRVSWERHGKSVLVAKLIPGDVRGPL